MVKQLLHVPFGLNGFCLKSLHPDAKKFFVSFGVSSKGDVFENDGGGKLGLDLDKRFPLFDERILFMVRRGGGGGGARFPEGPINSGLLNHRIIGRACSDSALSMPRTCVADCSRAHSGSSSSV